MERRIFVPPIHSHSGCWKASECLKTDTDMEVLNHDPMGVMSLSILLPHWGYPSCSHDWSNGWGLKEFLKLFPAVEGYDGRKKSFLSGMDSMVVCWEGRRDQVRMYHFSSYILRCSHPWVRMNSLQEELRTSRSDSQRLILRGMVDIAKFSLSLAIENCSWLHVLCLL